MCTFFSLLHPTTTTNTQKEQILKEYRQRVIKCHPDKTGSTNNDEFNRLQKAKEVLTCQESRKIYDKWMDSGISLPFERWITINQNVHSSMHWMKKKSTKPMLSCGENKLSKNAFQWQRDENQILQKFRNYEI